MIEEVQTDTSGTENHPHCYREENALTLRDLCEKCPITSRIAGGLPRIRAEIEVHRQGNTRAGFTHYCEKALAHHVELAAQFANDLANPAKHGSLQIGTVLEIKFWNLALCELYKAELEPPQESARPPQSFNAPAAATLAIHTAPQNAAQTSEGLKSLLADIHQHFPGILSWPFVPYPLEFVLPGLACYVGEVWASPRQHSAPQDFDRAYYNQSPAGRRDFRAALRRVYDALTKELSSDPFGSQLFATMSWKETDEALDQSKEAMHALAQRGAAWLGGWLNWRELPPADQLLAALDTVGIANHNLRLTAAEPERPPCLYVPDCAPEDEGPRFAALLREFERALPGKKSKRRDLLSRLERLRTLPLALLRDGLPHTLPARFSALHWPGLLERPAESEVLETFWPDLEQALKTRIEWAGRAHSIVAGTLSAPAPQPLDLPAPTVLPIDNVLAMPRPTLDQLLLDAVMIEPAAEPGRYKARPGVKPWQWANVRAALREKLLLAEISDADAAQLFTETYGAIVKRSTMQHRPQAEQNSKNKTRRVLAYAEFLKRLPNPKS